jgi:RNA polymerase sigma-70 factor (ECF subfamily)
MQRRSPVDKLVLSMNELTPDTRASLLGKLKESENSCAWNDFTEIYVPVIRRTALRMGLQNADADNVVQDVLLVVSQAIHQWLDRPERGSFRAWLFRIAKNKALDLLTRKATRPENAPNRHWESIADRDTAISSFWESEYRLELFSRAAKEIQKAVSESTWQAFWMSTVEAVPIKEVAEKLGVREGVVYLSRCRVLNRIRTLVKQWENAS